MRARDASIAPASLPRTTLLGCLPTNPPRLPKMPLAAVGPAGDRQTGGGRRRQKKKEEEICYCSRLARSPLLPLPGRLFLFSFEPRVPERSSRLVDRRHSTPGGPSRAYPRYPHRGRGRRRSRREDTTTKRRLLRLRLLSAVYGHGRALVHSDCVAASAPASAPAPAATAAADRTSGRAGLRGFLVLASSAGPMVAQHRGVEFFSGSPSKSRRQKPHLIVYKTAQCAISSSTFALSCVVLKRRRHVYV